MGRSGVGVRREFEGSLCWQCERKRGVLREKEEEEEESWGEKWSGFLYVPGLGGLPR